MRNPFIPTDFPDPVWPAIKRCGIRARSVITYSPLIFFPSAIASLDGCFWKAEFSITSLRDTTDRFSLGSSIPTRPIHGIGACIRRVFALSARARSFFRFSILESFTHSAGARRYWITVGQTSDHFISTSILNFKSVSSISKDLASISRGLVSACFGAFLRWVILGSFHPLKSISLHGRLTSSAWFGVCFMFLSSFLIIGTSINSDSLEWEIGFDSGIRAVSSCLIFVRTSSNFCSIACFFWVFAFVSIFSDISSSSLCPRRTPSTSL